MNAIFIGSKKAYGVVDHSTLIRTLNNLSIVNPFLFWLAFYFNNRRQFISTNSVLSDLCVIPSALVGHHNLLFIIFVTHFPIFSHFLKYFSLQMTSKYSSKLPIFLTVSPFNLILNFSVTEQNN